MCVRGRRDKPSRSSIAYCVAGPLPHSLGQLSSAQGCDTHTSARRPVLVVKPLVVWSSRSFRLCSGVLVSCSLLRVGFTVSLLPCRKLDCHEDTVLPPPSNVVI